MPEAKTTEITGTITTKQDSGEGSVRAECVWHGETVAATMPYDCGSFKGSRDELHEQLACQALQSVTDQVKMRELGVFVVAPA